jgi:transcriptional regulator with XRE-family HTH domain
MAHQEIPQVDVGSATTVSIPFGTERRGTKEASGELKSAQELKVGEQIREVRKAKRIRQKVLARMVGISPGALTNFEKGRRRISLDWLHRIAEALDTPVAYFLPDENEKDRATPGDPRERRLLNAWRLLGRSDVLRADFLQLLEHLGRAKGLKKQVKRAS